MARHNLNVSTQAQCPSREIKRASFQNEYCVVNRFGTSPHLPIINSGGEHKKGLQNALRPQHGVF